MNKKILKTLALVALFFFAAFFTNAQAQNYQIKNLGTLGGDYSDADGGINNTGQVAGVSKTAGGDYHAYFYDPATNLMRDIGALAGGNFSRANGINDAGLIVGRATTASDKSHAFLYNASTQALTDLHSAVSFGGTNSSALAVNNSGQIVGWSEDASGKTRAFVYNTATNQLTDLSALTSLSNVSFSIAYAVNDAGKIAGAIETADGILRTIVWNCGGIGASGCGAGTHFLMIDNNSPAAINNAGIVVGDRQTANQGDSFGYVFRNNASEDAVKGSCCAGLNNAKDISNNNAVVGSYLNTNLNSFRAFLTDLNAGTTVDLNAQIPGDSGWTLLDAAGVADNDRVAGTGVVNGQTRAYVLTPNNFVSYTISGQIKRSDNNSPIGGAAVALSGSVSAMTTTDANGNYSFTFGRGGDFTVTPTKIGNSFLPASRVFNSISQNQTANFTAEVVTKVIGGKIQTAGGANLQGVDVVLSGAQSGATTTDANGNYSFTVVEGGTYTMTPAKSGYVFVPGDATVFNLSREYDYTFYNFEGRSTFNGAAYWNGNNNAFDWIGTNHGTWKGSTSYGTGIVNQAFSFGGYSNSVEVPHNFVTSRAPTAPLSLNLWAYRTDSSDAVHLVGKRSGCDGDNINYQMGIHAGGGLGLFFGSGAGYAATGADVVPVNQWVMLTGTFDGTTLRLYKNGSLVASTTGTLGAENISPFKIGSSGTCDQNGGGWHGQIDEVKIYDRALSAADIQALYNQDAAEFTISGTVTRNSGGSSPLQGIDITLSGSSKAITTTDANGNYSFNVARGGTYTVTPSSVGSTFTPANQTFNAISQNQTADFTAQFVTRNVGGIIQSGGVGLAGVTVSVSGSQNISTTTDVNGNYSLSLNEGGNYTVTPSKTGYIFTPSNRAVNNLQTDQTAINFNGTATANMSAFWKGDGNTLDSVGTNHGTLHGDANYTSGLVGQAFNFDGTGDAVEVPHSAAVSRAATAPLTVNFWAFRSDATDRINIIGKRQGCDGDNINYLMGIHNSVGLGLFFGSGSTGGVYARTNVDSVPVNLWVMLTGTFDGTTVRLYMDGNLLASATGKLGPENTAPFKIGHAGNCAPGEGWRGQLDEVKLYDRALTQAEIQALYNQDTLNLSISGKITRGGGALAGVTVNLTGDDTRTTTTDANGNYNFNLLRNRSYTVTPSFGTSVFTPASQSFNTITTNKTANFAANVVAFNISGNVSSENGTNLPGVTVALSGSQTATTTTDAGGNYSFSADAGGNYTVTPSGSGGNYLYNPASRTITNLQSNQAANFTGAQPTGGIDTSFGAGGVTDGKVQSTASAVQPDGKIIIGGGFSLVNGAEKNTLARMNADGSLDSSFNQNGIGPNSTVYEIIVLSDGKILIAGAFTTYNGAAASGIARLNSDGSLDTSFNQGGTGVSGIPHTLSLQTDGKILMSGNITAYNGTARFNVLRINADGSLDTSFTSPFTSNQYTEEVEFQPSDGKILICGTFTIGSPAIKDVARLNPNGTVDTTFNSGGVGTDGGGAYAMQLLNDGKILVGGRFLTYNGTARSRIARLNADGSLDTNFVPPVTTGAGVEYFAVQPADGKVVVAGGLTLNGASYPALRLNTDGSLDNSFALKTSDNVGYGVRLQSDGKIILVGFFNVLDSQPRRNVVRLNTDGNVDGSFNAALVGWGYAAAIARQPDGKIIAVGNFEYANGAARSNIARFNTDGTLDTTFTSGSGTYPDPGNAANIINAVAVQADGKIVIAGGFGGYNGTARRSIARLNPDGTLDASFNATGLTSMVSSSLTDFVILPDGTFLVGGVVQMTGGQFRLVFRLNADGSDAATLPQPNNTIIRTISQPDGKVLVVGNFTTWGGQSRNRVARLNSDGTLDTTFNPGTGANAQVASVAVQPADGKILIGGSFGSYNGTARKTLTRLNSNGSLDTSFDPANSTNTFVETISVQADGKIIIGGRFANFNGVPSNRLARLNADGSFDPTFVSGFDNDARFFVHRTLVQPDGRLVVGGLFKAYNGATRYSLLRLETAPSYTIAGQITRNNTGLSGVSVALSGSATTGATTDASGNYSFSVAGGGNYTVTPSLANNVFSPPSQTFNSVSANQTANFAATLLTYSVSGNVKADGLNLPGATVSLGGSSLATTTTDVDGNYSFNALNAGGNYNVTVSKNGYVFNPSNQSVNNLQGNQVLNFQNGVPLCTPPPGGLVSWYRAEDNGNDSSGYGNNATLNETTYAIGKVGKSFNLDGLNDFVIASDSSSNSVTGAISFAAWVRPDTISGFRTILSKHDASVANGASYIFFIVDGKLGVELDQNLNTYRQVISTNAVVAVNAFTHVAASFDPATQSSKLYVNGSEVPSALAPGSSSVTAISDNSTPVRLGVYVNGNQAGTGYFDGLLDEVQIFNGLISSASVLSMYNSGSVGVCSDNIAPTPTGNNVSTAPTNNISLNFQNVSSGGTTVAIPVTSNQIPALPGGFTLSSGGPVYDIRTSAQFSGNLTITFNIPNVADAQTCSSLRILHYENGAWTSANNGAPVFSAGVCTVTQTVASLSPFIVAKVLAPTAGQVSVGGRVLTLNGRGISNTLIYLTGADGNVKIARSNSFGYYQFEGISAGATYIISVRAKKYSFRQATQVVNVGDDLTDVNFVGVEEN